MKWLLSLLLVFASAAVRAEIHSGIDHESGDAVYWTLVTRELDRGAPVLIDIEPGAGAELLGTGSHHVLRVAGKHAALALPRLYADIAQTAAINPSHITVVVSGRRLAELAATPWWSRLSGLVVRVRDPLDLAALSAAGGDWPRIRLVYTVDPLWSNQVLQAASRLRAAGVSVELAPVHAAPVLDDGAVAFSAALVLPRLQRFEFARQSPDRFAWPRGRAEAFYTLPLGERVLIRDAHNDLMLFERDDAAESWRASESFEGFDVDHVVGLTARPDGREWLVARRGDAWLVLSRQAGRWREQLRVEGASAGARAVVLGDTSIYFIAAKPASSWRVDWASLKRESMADAPFEAQFADWDQAAPVLARLDAGTLRVARFAEQGWQETHFGAPLQDGGIAAMRIIHDGGAESFLVASSQGRLLRFGASGSRLELDPAPAWKELSGRVPLVTRLGAFSSLEHPETGERVLAVPVRLRDALGEYSQLLLRQRDGAFALADLASARDEELLSVQSARSSDRHGASLWWLANSAQGVQLAESKLQRSAPRRGIWWNPDKPGQGLEWLRVANGFNAVLAGFDARGEASWSLSQGALRNRRYRAELSRLEVDGRLTMLSTQAQPARIMIDFSATSATPECRARGAVAPQLAILQVERDGRVSRECLQPFENAAGPADTDVNGAWFAGVNDAGWGLSVTQAGEGSQAVASAVLYFHDADGAPRWALASGAATAQGAALALQQYSLSCTGCAAPRLESQSIGEASLRFSGWCGAPALRAALSIRTPSTRFERPEVPMVLLSESRCY